MNYDIRVVEDAVTGITQIAHVTYGDGGQVSDVMQPPISEHANLEGALLFLNMLYQASIKPVLIKFKEGDYE